MQHPSMLPRNMEGIFLSFLFSLTSSHTMSWEWYVSLGNTKSIVFIGKHDVNFISFNLERKFVCEVSLGSIKGKHIFCMITYQYYENNYSGIIYILKLLLSDALVYSYIHIVIYLAWSSLYHISVLVFTLYLYTWLALHCC